MYASIIVCCVVGMLSASEGMTKTEIFEQSSQNVRAFGEFKETFISSTGVMDSRYLKFQTTEFKSEGNIEKRLKIADDVINSQEQMVDRVLQQGNKLWIMLKRMCHANKEDNNCKEMFSH
ncbi:Uncharacterised protein g5893 [Pycnogonum litorale]